LEKRVFLSSEAEKLGFSDLYLAKVEVTNGVAKLVPLIAFGFPFISRA
jgi:hypothetical protein